MDIISFSQGNFFLYKAISEADPIFSASLLHQVGGCFILFNFI